MANTHHKDEVTKQSRLLIRNIGLMLSGDLENPILDADVILAIDGKITSIGKEKDIDGEGATLVIDAKGTTVTPGLIDSHVHPVAGDWTPRQNQIGWIDSYLHGGVTTMISAGEVHTPGRPKDVVGLKAMAVFAQRAFSAFRPGGVRVHAGAPVIEHGMVEEAFKDLAAAGVTMLGEVGLGSVKDGSTARQMVAWARKYGIQSTIHTGGPSIPGSSLIDKDIVLAADADVIGHINGGHTALPRRSDRDALRKVRASFGSRTQWQRESGIAYVAYGWRSEASGSSNRGNRFSRRIGGTATRYSANDFHAVLFGRDTGRNGNLFCHR